MTTSNEERFGELLTEAVHAIKRRTSKPIAAIQDELMYALGRETGNPVEYWRKGHIPASQTDFAQLARELIARGHLSQEWLRQFWGCTDFVGLDEVEREIFPQGEKERRGEQKQAADGGHGRSLGGVAGGAARLCGHKKGTQGELRPEECEVEGGGGRFTRSAGRRWDRAGRLCKRDRSRRRCRRRRCRRRR